MDKRISVAALGLAAVLAASFAAGAAAPRGIDKIGHVIVVILENRSFDHLYGRFPGADGIVGRSFPPQVDEHGEPYAELPAFTNRPIDPSLPSLELPPLPNGPFDLSDYWPMDRPLNAEFEQANNYFKAIEAINGGRMDRYVAISGSPAMGTYDGSKLPMWRYAERYTLADNFFQGAFGPTGMNHFMLFCACVPRWPDAPEELRAKFGADGRLERNGILTPDGHLVGNLEPKRPEDMPPLQTMPHIGDRLDEAGVSWTWYTARWNSNHDVAPSRPFLLFADTADGSAGAERHVKDDSTFPGDLASGNLAQVVFLKPGDNEHPGRVSGSLLQDDQEVATLIASIEASPVWKDTAVIVTYDEGHGFWDHVPPPVVDRWGPGRRIPTIVISPFARRGFVDHTQYDTTSILKFIETRFHLNPLGTRDAAAADMTAAFEFD